VRGRGNTRIGWNWGPGSAGGGGDLAIRRGRERLRRDFEAGEKKMESLGRERAWGELPELDSVWTRTRSDLGTREERARRSKSCTRFAATPLGNLLITL
jgi:hypothetical protein